MEQATVLGFLSLERESTRYGRVHYVLGPTFTKCAAFHAFFGTKISPQKNKIRARLVR